MKNTATGIAGYFFAALFALISAAPEAQNKDDLAGKVTWPQEYILDIPRPESLIKDSKTYLPAVVQNLIMDELSLQRQAITRSKVHPAIIEYPVRKDHENLPANERADLMARFPKPEVLQLKIARLTEAAKQPFQCAELKNERYTLLTRISARQNQVRLEILLCQGNETLLTQSTLADEQELVTGVNRLINPVRAKLTGDRYASLHIDTAPARGAVYLDGQYLGKTPLKYSYLIPGKYDMVIKQDGYESFRAPVTVQPGDTFTGKYDLVPAKGIGSVEVNSEPQGAKIYLDADYKGLTPKTLSNIPPGNYRLHVISPGKGEVFRNITIDEKNTSVKVSETLTGFAFGNTPGFIGLSYKTWYLISVIGSAACFGTALGFYIWRDAAQEDIYARLNGKATSAYTQEDNDFVSERKAAYTSREGFATGFMVGAGVLALTSIFFYVQHLLAADEGIVMKQPGRNEGDVDIRIGAMPGQTGLSASFRF